MAKEYKIMNIGDGTDSRHGKIVIVKANPINEFGLGKSFIPYICDETKTFFFPANQEAIIEQLMQIANGGGFWTPDLTDFQSEYVLDEDAGKRKCIFRHRSFWRGKVKYNHDINSGQKVQLIANKTYKINALYEQYIRKGWANIYTFEGYVESLAEDDINTHFWRYLFNTSEYNALLPIDLPSEYYTAYRKFLDICSTRDLL